MSPPPPPPPSHIPPPPQHADRHTYKQYLYLKIDTKNNEHKPIKHLKIQSFFVQ